MTHLDIMQYSDRELSLLVYNTENLYINRYTITESLLYSMGVKYTQDQWDIFQEDLSQE